MEYKAYSFDLDDNLLKLPTLIRLKDKNDEIKEFTTLEFEKIRADLDNLNLRVFAESFEGFTDNNQFLIDIEKSTKAGSWENLENCIVKHNSIFAIITARGHSPDTIRKGLKSMILKHFTSERLDKFVTRFSEKYKIATEGKSQEEVLDIYLDLCKFYPVNDEEIKKKFGSEDISELKSIAFEDFQNYVRDYVKENFGEKTEVKIGFSDDSVSHLKVMVNSILKKHGLFFYQTNDSGKNGFI